MKLRSCFATVIACSAVGSTACNAYRLDPPTGFAEVYSSEEEARMKGSRDVGLDLRVFENVEGGTLGFWSEDLVHKLSERGYRLTSQGAVESKNGVVGTRFDFSYTPPTQDEGEQFYSVVLFVSDAHRVVLQLAGDQQWAPTYQSRLDQIANDTVVRGCRLVDSKCRGPQPQAFSLPPRAPANDEYLES